jgi:putative ABC transport system permease protein
MGWLCRAELGRENRKMKRTRPPKIAESILAILSSSRKTGILGDAEEEYRMILSEKGRFRADMWYIWQILKPVPFFIRSTLYWRSIMFKNYVKIALRNIKRHKGYSFINITGLAIGIACSILIHLFVAYELSYDKFYERADDIYRLAFRATIGDTKINQTFTSSENFKKLLQDFPEIETGVKFLVLGRTPVTIEEKTFYESRFYAVDSTFYDIFSIPLVHGNPKTALTNPDTMVISRDTALKYFGTTDVLGKIVHADYSEGSKDFEITGVSENVPENSHFHYDLLISTANFPALLENNVWDANMFITYFLLKPGTSKNIFDEKLKKFTKKYMGGKQFDEWLAKGNSWEYFLQPITSIHLTSDMGGEFEANGSRTYVIIFSIISMLILLMACINFINLSTAKSTLRTKEVGLRKVLGSDRNSLMVQFLSESVFLSFISLALSIAIVHCFLPAYRTLIGRNIEIHYFDNLTVIPSLFILGLAVGVISGLYPALFQSSFKPITTLRSKTGMTKGSSSLRNILVTFQFTFTIVLIIGTLVVLQQIKFFQNKKLGFEKEHVLVIQNSESLGNSIVPFKETLRQNSQIIAVSGSDTLPGSGFRNLGFGAEGGENVPLNICICDYDFLKTLKIEVAQGRFFSKEFPSDSHAAVLNEEAVKQIGWDDPINKKINNWLPQRGDFTVIGVIKNYHYESLHQTIRPQVLLLSGGYHKDPETFISVRLNTEDISGIVSYIKKAWNNFAPHVPFEYSFLDADYDKLFTNERQTRKLFSTFTFLAIFIACLGIFGLASFTAERYTREIGIRKVLGASVSGIIMNLSKKFTASVVLANVIAWPVAYYFMNRWLGNFAYRIHLNIWIFILSGLAALAIALLSVSYQSIKAATANPVDSLRYE